MEILGLEFSDDESDNGFDLADEAPGLAEARELAEAMQILGLEFSDDESDNDFALEEAQPVHVVFDDGEPLDYDHDTEEIYSHDWTKHSAFSGLAKGCGGRGRRRGVKGTRATSESRRGLLEQSYAMRS